jgi:8-oxo-dGTP pyrophosphatase MutT (NUDIX family)
MRVKSATVLLFNGQGKLLAVSRGHDHRDWGMPGGWIEPGEKPVEAASRELWEETGLLVYPEDLRMVYKQAGCATFTPTDDAVIYGEIDAMGGWILQPQGAWEGYVNWLEPRAIACSTCTFGKPNSRMLRDLGLL